MIPYFPTHFVVSELVHPSVFMKYGNDAIHLLDQDMLRVIDHLRDIFGKCTINGGSYKHSGLRIPDTGYSLGSAHMFGKAFDLKFEKADPKDVHEYIQVNQVMLYEMGLRRVEALEATPTWTHIDSKPAPMRVSSGQIYFFKP